MRTFTSFFRPAAPAGIPLDYETAARARALQVIVWTMLGVGLLVLVLAPFISGTGPYLRLVRAVSIAYAIGGMLLFLNARGKTRQASILLIIGFSLFATWLALTAGGIRANAVNWYVIVVAVAGLLLGEVAGFVAAGLVSVLSLSLVITEALGYLPIDTVTHTPTVVWYGVLWTVIAIASVQHFAARTIRDALHRTQQELAERTRIEESLRKQEAMLSTVLNAIPQSVFWKDRSGTYLGCNTVFSEAAGLEDPCHVTGKTDFDLPWPRSEAEAYRRDDHEVMQTRNAKRHIVEPLQRVDGTRRWIDTSKVPLLDGNGQVYGVLGVYDDVTDRLRAEEALQKREALFRAVVENSYDAVLLLNKDRQITYVSPSFSRIAGYSPPEIEETYGPLYTHPDDRAVTERKFFEALAAPGSSVSVEYRARHKQGHWIWIEATITNLLDDPNVQSMVLNIRDITDRKRADEAVRKSESYYRALINNTPDIISGFDREGRYLFVNASVARVSDLPPSHFIGKRMGEVPGFTPKQVTERLALIREVYETRVPYEGEFQFRASDRELTFEWRVCPVLDSEGNVLSVFSINRDITERKKADRALQESMEQLHTLSSELEHAREQERKSTAREVHDELGQILTAIRMAVERVERAGNESRAAGPLETSGLLALVDQGIHAVQRIAARLRPGILDDLGLLPAIEWRVEEFQAQSGIACRLSLPDAEPAIDEGRSTTLFRILGELLTNVARHAKATFVVVCLADTPEEFTLSVKDNGIGVADKDVRSPRALGFKGIEERLYPFGGSRVIQAEPGQGTEVIIHLPKKDRTREASYDPTAHR